MYHGMYEYRDEFDKPHYLSCRVGGFKSVEQAAKAVTKRSPVGYVSDARNVVLHVIHNGRIVKVV